MKDEAVKVTEEVVETAANTGNKEVMLVVGGIAIGVIGTIVIRNGIDYYKKSKAEKKVKPVKVEAEEE